MQEVQVQSLIGEVRFHMSHGTAKKKIRGGGAMKHEKIRKEREGMGI